MRATLWTVIGAVGCVGVSSAKAQVARIELTPKDVGSGSSATFSTFPTLDPALYLGFDAGANVRAVNFNSAPDGPLSEGGSVTNQYQSLGVRMNEIRVSGSIYGGNNYGAGFATEDNIPQVYTFTSPVIAVGIVNTSPDRDLVQFWSGPDATGELLLEFHDQEDVAVNFNIDRFVGGRADPGVTIGSFVIQNQSGDLELDELVFVVATCNADFNRDGVVNSQDFFDFLAAFFTQSPSADFNADSQVNSQDFFDFLTAFFAGC